MRNSGNLTPSSTSESNTVCICCLFLFVITNRVALDLIFSNPTGAGFGIADPAGAGAGAECS